MCCLTGYHHFIVAIIPTPLLSLLLLQSAGTRDVIEAARWMHSNPTWRVNGMSPVPSPAGDKPEYTREDEAGFVTRRLSCGTCVPA